MHEKTEELTAAIIESLRGNMPGGIVRVVVETDQDVSKSYDFAKFYTAVAGCVEKVMGFKAPEREPETHNERSARRQAIAADRDRALTFVPGEEPKSGIYTNNPDAVSHEVSETVELEAETVPAVDDSESNAETVTE